MTEKKLNVDHFYAQFHNHELHDNESEASPRLHDLVSETPPAGKPLDLKALRNMVKREAEPAVPVEAIVEALRKNNNQPPEGKT